jgi:hypothetical protein
MSDHPEIRPDRVSAVVAVMVDNDLSPERRVDAIFQMDDVTDAERAAAVGVLHGLAVKEVDVASGDLNAAVPGSVPTSRGLLDLTYSELQAEVRRGVALGWVLDRLGPVWASRPATPLVDVIKILRPAEVEHLATVLRDVAGIELDGR